jgi:hypothetical protein
MTGADAHLIGELKREPKDFTDVKLRGDAQRRSVFQAL